MKRFVMTMIAAAMIGSTAFAQGEGHKGRRPKMDKTEMVKHRTDETVKKYNLNEDQARQLLDLNTKYADKLGHVPRGGHHGRHHGGRPPRDGQKFDHQADAATGATPQQPQEHKRLELTEEQKAKFEAQRKEQMAARKAYDEELQKIMTPEQFKAYQEDMKSHGGRGGRGHRPHRD